MIHKLAEGPITLTIARIEAQVGNFGPQYALYGTNDELVYVSEKSTLSGLSRLNLTPESVVGETIRIEQVKKDGKTYTNISKSSGGNVTPSAVASPAAPAAPKAPVDLPALIALYGQCLDGAMMTFALRMEETGTPYDGAAVQAAAATLFIKATR
jgi:hypothetical protein